MIWASKNKDWLHIELQLSCHNAPPHEAASFLKAAALSSGLQLILRNLLCAYFLFTAWNTHRCTPTIRTLEKFTRKISLCLQYCYSAESLREYLHQKVKKQKSGVSCTEEPHTLYFHQIWKLAEHNRIQLVWVPGHMGVDGNEMTDQPARQGSWHPLMGPQPPLGISAKVAREVIGD
jgi:hypothetical protein